MPGLIFAPSLVAGMDETAVQTVFCFQSAV
jgi:hypothetical protein